MRDKSKVVITKNGPYVVFGSLPLDKQTIIPDEDGVPYKYKQGEKFPKQETYLLCRCGKSKNKPYCDQTHLKIGFKAKETASKEKYLNQAEMLEGPDLDLSDAASLCASASFCDRAGGTWQLTKNSNNAKSKKLAVEQCANCPSGRLVAWDKKTGKAIEPKFEKSISIIEDAASNTSGPVWVKGGVQIEEDDGEKLEIRNRVTLCRCGKSKNKPYCDGSHIEVDFNDGDESLKTA
ncbi:MAG: CDGSH iron-sulfur domain-containing protein [Candidatus Daviesbacteria bacterium]|nr:CDGSH iron-sulfur domain-containing protein [Candidatus Daviesbacteria bacterium]